ncbi:MAG: hypothetical protein IIX11_02065, partial [Selenomonadales bacterium]|nr:hypothetical protein [Selenomonadales bacterium]
MKRSLLASALITMLITATAFAGDAEAAPNRGGHRGGAPHQSTQVQKQRPPQARPHKAPQMKPQRTQSPSCFSATCYSTAVDGNVTKLRLIDCNVSAVYDTAIDVYGNVGVTGRA